MRPQERWRDGIARRHRSTIFPEDYQQLFRGQFADLLVTHEAPSAHPHGWQAIDNLAKMLGVRLLVHGHRHENIDYVSHGLMDASAPFRAFGVDKCSHLSWPLEEGGAS
jgi:hypothetical protein